MHSAIKPRHLEKAMSYEQYFILMEDLVAQNKTTGPNQSDEMIGYTRLNLQRMKRLQKTVSLKTELTNAVSKINAPGHWVILTESWCGDAAQSIPVLAQLAAMNSLITIKLLLRDEHLDLIDHYLTEGGRSIPKLIWIKKEDRSEVATWGPRPEPAQKLLREYRSNPDETYAAFSERLQRWYNQDKTHTLQQDLIDMIKSGSKL